MGGMYGIPEPCLAFHRCFARKQSLCVFTLFPGAADRQIPYNPVPSLQPMCLPGFPIPTLFTSLLLLSGEGKFRIMTNP